MDSYTGTAAAVLQALTPYKLKKYGAGQYRCYSPLRPDSNSRSFSLKIEDSEHGTWFDHVTGQGGSLIELAKILGVYVENNPSYYKTNSNSAHLENSKGLTLEQFSENKQISLEFLQSLGIKQVIGKYGLPELRIPYHNLDGTVFRERIRYALRAKDGSAWVAGEAIIPYGLDRIKDRRWTILVEGESDAITAWANKLPALGIPGASSCNCLQHNYIQDLHTVYYWKEPDKGGDTFAKKLLERLSDIGFTGKCFEISLEGVKDLSALYLRDTENFFLTLSEALEHATPISIPTPTPNVPVIETPQATEATDDFDLAELTPWPTPLSSSALYGVVGQIVQAIEPHTEADPSAMLMQFLTCFGSLIGRTAYFILDGSKHFTNLFLIVIGASATGRKGTSFNHVKNLLNAVDPNWSKNCIAEGLSSGEGLIYTIRDPIFGVNKEGSKIITDLGCEDKRLLTLETEFMNTLGVMTRQGNTLSAMIRRAWNGEILATLTKNSPTKATDPHISIIGHITKNEYLKGLTKTETSNGFVNRFLHCASKRSKSLPIGGKLHTVDFAPMLNQLLNAVEFAKSTSQIKMDHQALELWTANYEHLVGEAKRSGLFAEVTARATGQVIRLAMIYALLDLSIVIRPQHLQAALECWRYAEDSAKYVFGNMASDPVAEKIFKALKSTDDGLTQKQLYNLFSRNIPSPRIQAALSTLLESGHISFSKKQSTNPSGGRPTIVWFVLKQETSE